MGDIAQLGDETGHRLKPPHDVGIEFRPRLERVEAARWKIRKTARWDRPLAGLGDPLPDELARRLAVHPGLRRPRQAGLAKTQRQEEIILRRQPDAVLFMMVLVRKAHEAR